MMIRRIRRWLALQCVKDCDAAVLAQAIVILTLMATGWIA